MGIADVLRDIARGGLAGLLGGVVVGGIGGRVAMRIAALANPQATGLPTENGEIVGAITLNGTIALILFGGLVAGLLAGFLWVILRPWIPGSGRGRIAITALISVPLGGFGLVQASNPDFLILDPDGPLVAMLLALVALVGATVAWLDAWLERRLPAAVSAGQASTTAYGVVAALGVVLATPLALTTYFNANVRPEAFAAMGLAIMAVGLATALWWIVRSRAPQSRPPAALVAIGRTGLVVAVAIGSWILLVDGLSILGPN